MKRVLIILLWVAIIGYYLVALSFVSERRRGQICTAVEVAVVDSTHSRFVTAKDIFQMVTNKNQKITGNRFDSINIPVIEQHLGNFSPIRRADIYKTVDGKVHIDVSQRTPIVRVINRYGENFYIDDQGEILLHSSRYCAHVLVANGYINLRPEQKSHNVLTAEMPKGKRNIMRELFQLANYINSDRFWKAQIQQIYVNEDGDFELVPTVGAHVIIFGAFDKPDAKFAKLESFYRHGLNVKGWNTYDMINLKYEGQIIATKR